MPASQSAHLRTSGWPMRPPLCCVLLVGALSTAASSITTSPPASAGGCAPLGRLCSWPCLVATAWPACAHKVQRHVHAFPAGRQTGVFTRSGRLLSEAPAAAMDSTRQASSKQRTLAAERRLLKTRCKSAASCSAPVADGCQDCRHMTGLSTMVRHLQADTRRWSEKSRPAAGLEGCCWAVAASQACRVLAPLS